MSKGYRKRGVTFPLIAPAISRSVRAAGAVYKRTLREGSLGNMFGMLTHKSGVEWMVDIPGKKA